MINKFNRIVENIFIPADDEEVESRRAAALEIEKKEIVQLITSKMVHGVYPESLDLFDKKLGSLEFLEDIGLREVLGFFSCAGNHLTTLKGCPKIVVGTFYCFTNRLTNLEYCPELRERNE